jgi:fumarylacetoacetate (FAA) hydrolase
MRRPYPNPAARPPSIRDFMAFEEHITNARRNRGQEVPEAWYRIPVFYFTNPGAVYRDGEEIPKPADTAMLDYELELACVIGADGRPEGFTIMNDFSARDLQGLEMPVGLGPAKGKDFATALGPVLVSPDELPLDLDMRAIARVNGEVRTDSRTGGMHYSWEQLIEAATRNTPGLVRGEVIGSGTVGRGCILEHGDGRWLEVGDEIELEIEGIGVLRNRVV